MSLRRRWPKASQNTRRRTHKLFEDAETIKGTGIVNPLHIEELHYRGLSRLLGRSDTAFLAAIESGVDYAYGIQKVYGLNPLTVRGVLKRLLETKTIEKSEIELNQNQQARVTYKITEDGRKIIGMMQRQRDLFFTLCREWIRQKSLEQKRPGEPRLAT